MIKAFQRKTRVGIWWRDGHQVAQRRLLVFSSPWHQEEHVYSYNNVSTGKAVVSQLRPNQYQGPPTTYVAMEELYSVKPELLEALSSLGASKHLKCVALFCLSRPSKSTSVRTSEDEGSENMDNWE